MLVIDNAFEAKSLSLLLELLGTVLGLITSFASLTLGDVSGAKTIAVTGEISEALVSTASGLVVAIFTAAKIFFEPSQNK